MTVSYNKGTGMIDLIYDPACDATEHTIYYGDLADVGDYSYSGAVCNVGASGTASFDSTGMGNLFFVITGNNGTVEGSFGLDGSGGERPEDTLATGVCDHSQDLTGTCL
jgi:hypothetical protein